MSKTCTEAQYQVKYLFYVDWDTNKAVAMMSPVFLEDGSIHIAIAGNEAMVLATFVLVAGYYKNAIDYCITPLLESGEMFFATVDDQIPSSGLLYSLQMLLSDKTTGAGDFGPTIDCCVSTGPTFDLDNYSMVRLLAYNQLIASLPNIASSTSITLQQVESPSSSLLREQLLLNNTAVPVPTRKSDLSVPVTKYYRISVFLTLMEVA